MILFSIANARVLWYVTRGTGAAALLLLTMSVLLGVCVSLRWRGRRWPRFAVTSLHRNLTLLSIAFVVVHVVTTVADGYAPISITAAIVPYTTTYRPLWLGLGAVAFDLLLALVATSLWRRWLDPRTWRAIHWLAYAAWPVALLHAFGSGSDGRFGWFAVVGFSCLGAVLLALVARVALREGDVLIRAVAVAMAFAVTVAIVTWYRHGPLQRGWAKRAGTPVAILARRSRATPLARAPRVKLASFVSALSGTIGQKQASDGSVTVSIRMQLRGGPRGAVRIDLRGQPNGGGGVSLSESGVSFVPGTTRDVYTGAVVGLDGSHVVASARDSVGDRVQLDFRLRLETNSPSFSGVVAVSRRNRE